MEGEDSLTRLMLALCLLSTILWGGFMAVELHHIASFHTDEHTIPAVPEC